TCIGNSGPLPEEVADAVTQNDLAVVAVLSGNRNFEGRIHPLVRASYLASPPLVVAYALAGHVEVDLSSEPLGTSADGTPVSMKDLWPTPEEVRDAIAASVSPEQFEREYGRIFDGDDRWRALPTPEGPVYAWDPNSTYVREPPFFEDLEPTPGEPSDLAGSRCLVKVGDSITTDHISPAGSIKQASPAGQYLIEHHVKPIEYNQYGTRRGNHEVMMRGTFANIRIKNQMVPGVEGGVTIHYPDGKRMPIYDAAMQYKQEGVPLVVFAGKEYGTGSSRDWAAKGTILLGIRAVITQSFERIHRSNLVGMGVLPLVFEEGTSWQSLGLKGDEKVTIRGLQADLRPRQKVTAEIAMADGSTQQVPLICRIDTLDELEYFKNGGILQYVLRQLAA
ncbi:MAG: aconitase family protein, partial [Tardiphaga sp.]